MMDKFVEWHNSIRSQVAVVTSLTKVPVSDEPEALITDLREVEAWNARIGFLLADANGWLDNAKAFNMPPKELGTEADRRSTLDALVSPVRVVRDKLESLQDAIKQRLILGESLLAYHRQFHDREIKK